MIDKVIPEIRSRMMAAVRGRNTSLEKIVRSVLFAAGYRYRLHRRDLPGCPDIVLSRFRTAIFVHGCFWHAHDCPRGRRPTSKTDFWNTKLDGNIARDLRSQTALQAMGWHVEVIWQCALKTGCDRVLAYLDALREAGRMSEFTK
jgi:DNA mismatch endonuclease (patch repair protein)